MAQWGWGAGQREAEWRSDVKAHPHLDGVELQLPRRLIQQEAVCTLGGEVQQLAPVCHCLLLFGEPHPRLAAAWRVDGVCVG